MVKAVSEKVVLVDFTATVFAMVALPKRDSLRGLVTPCSQAQETKTRMMWQNCLTIPTIYSPIFHNFGLLFLIGPITVLSENPLLKNNTSFHPKTPLLRTWFWAFCSDSYSFEERWTPGLCSIRWIYFHNQRFVIIMYSASSERDGENFIETHASGIRDFAIC